MQCHSCIGKAKREHAASNVAEMSQIDSYFTSASAEEFLLKQDPLEILKKCKVLHIYKLKFSITTGITYILTQMYLAN